MYGAKTPKRQYAWSSSTAIRRLDVGWRRMRAEVATVKHYINKEGRRCWQGTKHLRGTQILAYICCMICCMFLALGWKFWEYIKKHLIYMHAYLGFIEAKGMNFGKNLRTYPLPFANAIVNLRDDLISSRPMEHVPSHDLPSGPQILAGMPDDDAGLFSFADLSSCYRYLRCGKGLKLPQQWHRFMPLEVSPTVPFLERDS